MTTIGLIGLGNMGRNHYRVLHDVLAPRYGLHLAVWDNLVGIEEGKLAQDVGFLKPEALIAQSQGVVIATPTKTHAYYVEMVLPLPMLVEKPYAPKAKDVLIEVAPLTTMVGYIERYNPAFLELLRIRKNGVLGSILAIETNRVNDVAHGSWKPEGIITDLGIHDLDLINQLILPTWPEDVAGNVVYRDDKVDCHANFSFTQGDVPCSCRLSWIEVEKRRTLVVYGTEATAFVDLVARTVTLSFASSAPNQLIRCDHAPEALEAELEEWLLTHVLRRRVNPRQWTDRTGAHAQEVAEMIKDSCRRVTWKATWE